MEWLDWYTTTKAAGVYLLSGELALLFSILVKTVAEKRKPRWLDLWEFIVYSIFVSMVAMLADTSPWVSIAIGAGAKPIWTAFDRALERGAPGLVRRLLTGVVEETDKKDV